MGGVVSHGIDERVVRSELRRWIVVVPAEVEKKLGIRKKKSTAAEQRQVTILYLYFTTSLFGGVEERGGVRPA